MKRLIKDKAGSISVLAMGLILLLLLIAFLIIELCAARQNYYDAETILQRSCNSAVEKNILDNYRADGILYMDVSGAEADFYSYIASDMPEKYLVTVSSITGTATPPTLNVTGTVTFPTIFQQYGVYDVTFDFTVKSTNYRIA